MKHMPHFISDYGNGLFPIMEQSVLYKETKCFSTVCKGSENQLTIK